MFEKDRLIKLLNENYPIFSILIGILLVSLSVGPYQNGDTAWEYQAAMGTIKWGVPYLSGWGNNIMNQPPVGFYVEALFFKIFGSSINNGVVLVTLFGIGCTALVYKIGKELYNKSTGLFAAVLFALTPWEFVLSRSFLIDAQCLFLSLLTLLIGMIAIRKGSFKLFMVTGVLFAAAFLTKFFAVFILIPLLLLYVYFKPKKLKETLGLFAAFFIPLIIFSFYYYQMILPEGWLFIFTQSDLAIRSSSGGVPSLFFVENFLANYGLGWFFIDAAVLSLIVCLTYKKFHKLIAFDFMCLATILSVLGINTFLGAVLNLNAPYLNSIKYDYQALPFLSLLAASLVTKSISLFDSLKSKKKMGKLLFFSVGLAGLLLVAAAIFLNINYTHQISTAKYLLFRVVEGKNVGYSLIDSSPVGTSGFLMNVQYLGFAVVLSGLFWAGKRKIYDYLNVGSHELYLFFYNLSYPMRRWIEEKSALSQAP